MHDMIIRGKQPVVINKYNGDTLQHFFTNSSTRSFARYLIVTTSCSIPVSLICFMSHIICIIYYNNLIKQTYSQKSTLQKVLQI